MPNAFPIADSGAFAALEEARADISQQQAAVTLARQQLGRARLLLGQGYATTELYDQRQQHVDGANAALAAATARVGEAEHALQAAQQTVALDQVNIADNTLAAPRPSPGRRPCTRSQRRARPISAGQCRRGARRGR